MEKIERSDYGMKVQIKQSDSSEKVLEADIVVVSVSLGVLKAKSHFFLSYFLFLFLFSLIASFALRRSITFEPELPKHKQDAIERLGFGFFLFPACCVLCRACSIVKMK